MLRGHALLHYHPLINSMTTAIPPDGLLRFFAHTGHVPEVFEFSKLEPVASG